MRPRTAAGRLHQIHGRTSNSWRGVVLDVRTTEDRTEWATPGSLHVDAYEALKAGDSDALARLDLPSDAPVVTVCGAGKVSLIAAEQWRARGIFARSLVGGMKA